MSIVDTVTLWLADAEMCLFAGKSLTDSLYVFPVDLLLTGELGAGKTTFIRGMAAGFGIEGPVTSPTFALEQRYKTASGREFLHLDLYRLRSNQAADVLMGSMDHDGVRCIEWADRLTSFPDGSRILLDFAEKDSGRSLTVSFEDIPLPSTEDITRWQHDMRLPAHVITHSAVVTDVALRLADHLLSRGTIVRRLALERAAQLHDLLRFIDFRPHTTPAGISHTKEEYEAWNAIGQAFPDMNHEKACATFLEQRGFSALASIILCHGVKYFHPLYATIEQKLLFYADKRATDHVVTLEERFQEFVGRYGPGSKQFSHQWRDQALTIERELFPDGAPI